MHGQCMGVSSTLSGSAFFSLGEWHGGMLSHALAGNARELTLEDLSVQM